MLLCLHGGGFVGGSMYTHRRLYAHIAKQTGVRALVLEYRQLPEHPHPAAAEDTEAAYRWLLSEGYERIGVVEIPPAVASRWDWRSRRSFQRPQPWSGCLPGPT